VKRSAEPTCQTPLQGRAHRCARPIDVRAEGISTAANKNLGCPRGPAPNVAQRLSPTSPTSTGLPHDRDHINCWRPCIRQLGTQIRKAADCEFRCDDSPRVPAPECHRNAHLAGIGTAVSVALVAAGTGGLGFATPASCRPRRHMRRPPAHPARTSSISARRLRGQRLGDPSPLVDHCATRSVYSGSVHPCSQRSPTSGSSAPMRVKSATTAPSSSTNTSSA